MLVLLFDIHIYDTFYYLFIPINKQLLYFKYQIVIIIIILEYTIIVHLEATFIYISSCSCWLYNGNLAWLSCFKVMSFVHIHPYLCFQGLNRLTATHFTLIYSRNIWWYSLLNVHWNMNGNNLQNFHLIFISLFCTSVFRISMFWL